MKLINIFHDFINLFYPNNCELCGEILVNGEKSLCTLCLSELPRTNFHTDKDNEVVKIFWGRTDIQLATAWYYFQKGGSVQKLLHRFKYDNRRNIGYDLGLLIGATLKNSGFNAIDLIIPVPLHKKQSALRGFNQSEVIARGLSESMGKPLDSKSLIRTQSNPTQTYKHRYERWNNVKGIFEVRHGNNLQHKHILLVDDVITTGATMESCISALLLVNGVKVSVFALAKA